MRIKRCYILTAVLAGFCFLTAITISAAPGDLDLTFGSGGKLTDRAGGANGVVVQPDGKIVVVGEANGNFSVVRYNPDGSPDITFGDNGRAAATFGSEYAAGIGVAALPDGKMVVAGFVCPCDD